MVNSTDSTRSLRNCLLGWFFRGRGVRLTLPPRRLRILGRNPAGGLRSTHRSGNRREGIRPRTTYVAAAASILLVGESGASIPLLLVTVLAAGFCVIGAQTSSNALAAEFYPTTIRLTGVGWALGIGRNRLDSRTVCRSDAADARSPHPTCLLGRGGSAADCRGRCVCGARQGP
ncbi:MAG: hypothetical protein DMG13_26340 [Acidobacteria bacterium]|nr:MAG: hypothetical protein DMG13_26340 [Acidobacteriota bacterium]